MNPLFRILDANINRAAEALRVIEEHFRFGKEDSALTTKLKKYRHELRGMFSPWNRELLAARDSARDPGRDARSGREIPRVGSSDVRTANFKRLEEALRVLEEYAKPLPASPAVRISALRFAVYTIEKTAAAAELRARLAAARLYLVATPGATAGRPFLESVETALRAGVDIVQFRPESGSDNAWLATARRIRRLADRHHAIFIMNNRPDLAQISGADGVHLGQDDLSLRAARGILGPDKIIGRSTHNLNQALRAAKEGADYIGFGPIFKTLTKPGRPAIGMDSIAAVHRRVSIPIFVIGGITAANLAPLVRAGARRAAVIRGILQAPDIAAAVRAFRHTLHEKILR
ncbi:MAG: thiamine phosphate synthase [Planctomycetota bacterium]